MRSKSKPSLADYLRFRAFIAPVVATLIWSLGVVAITIFTWATVYPVFGTVSSIVVFIASNTLWRLVVEFWVVLFSIHAAIKGGSGHNEQEETVEPPSPRGVGSTDAARVITWVALGLIALVAIRAGIDVLSILLYDPA
jgi:hypothetical protein